MLADSAGEAVEVYCRGAVGGSAGEAVEVYWRDAVGGVLANYGRSVDGDDLVQECDGVIGMGVGGNDGGMGNRLHVGGCLRLGSVHCQLLSSHRGFPLL